MANIWYFAKASPPLKRTKTGCLRTNLDSALMESGKWMFFLSVKKLGKIRYSICVGSMKHVQICSNDIYATKKHAHVCELCGARDPWWKHQDSYNGITCSEFKRKFIVETRASISSSHSCNWSMEALDTFPQSKDINGSSIGWYPMSISLNHIVYPGWQFGYKIKCTT